MVKHHLHQKRELKPGSFRVKGDIIEIAPPHTNEYIIKIDTFGDEVERIIECNALTGEIRNSYKTYPIFPAYDHASTRERIAQATKTILEELEQRVAYFKENGKYLEAERIDQRNSNFRLSLLKRDKSP